MNDQDRNALAEALHRQFDKQACGCDEDQHRGLERLVGAGAGRLGLRADRPPTDPAAINACLLAPQIARLIDHTVLKPETTDSDIRVLCAEAREHCFASVCVSPAWVPLAASELRGASSVVCTVIGFPHGAQRSPVKAFETEVAVRDGATEIDMVIGIGRIKSRLYDEVEEDIGAVVLAAQGHTVKVILETALLTDEEKVIACVLAQNAGADFVKTSTGFASHGALPADVALMRRVVGDQMGVKASGGIRSVDDAYEMVEHGATRLGASAGVAILKGLTSAAAY